MTRRRVVPRSIYISARRWFQKGPGNTYHSVSIAVNGKIVHVEPFTYGYGTAYLQTASNWLEKNGYLPGLEHYDSGASEALWRYCERKNCDFAEDVVDVTRRSDLHVG